MSSGFGEVELREKKRAAAWGRDGVMVPF